VPEDQLQGDEDQNAVLPARSIRISAIGLSIAWSRAASVASTTLLRTPTPLLFE
jgi:hypothetical protein